uniref:Uncharacterized protein n=1 Tax=Candidatus Phytoplasma australasiaticum subsp. australasiaticum TaxID=2832407 RepID=A0A7S7FZM0_9MOLU|nr:hypothetical protein H7685_01130 ['Parthenium hysterophorus' phyllody phytoplasma]
MIIILQSISRIFNGYLNYWDIIKITFYQYNYVYSDKFMNIVICCFNIIPVIFNVTINCLFFSLLYKKFKIYIMKLFNNWYLVKYFKNYAIQYL